MVLRFRGRDYAALETKQPVVPGQAVGLAAPPRCNDDPGQDPAIGIAQGLQAFTIDGVDPSIAFVVPAKYPHTLFYSGPLDVHPYPPAVQSLVVTHG